MGLTRTARKYERATFLCTVSMTVGGDAPIEVSSLDISLGGVGLISRAFVVEGEAVTLAFHLKNQAQAAVLERVAGRVVFSRSDVDGHRLGVEFYEPLNRRANPLLSRRVENL